MAGPPIERPWAKLRRACREGRGEHCRAVCACPVTGWLSLIGHSADVAAVMRALLKVPVIARRLARLLVAPELSPADLDRLTALAALHDLGKINQGFQRGPFASETFRAGHVGPLVTLFARVQPDRADPILDALCGAGQLDRVVHLLDGADDSAAPLDAIMAHHGHLPAPSCLDPRLWHPVGGYDPVEACRELVDAIHSWCPLAFEPPEPPAWTAPFGHAFAGLLTLADWLGSDAAVFRFPEQDVPDGRLRYAWALERAHDRLSALQITPTALREAGSARPWDWAGMFPKLAEPTFAQRAMLGLAWPAPAQGRVCLIEAETGSGKTEAALVHFLDLFRRGEVDGMYLALPTRAAAAQIQTRVACSLQRLLGTAAAVGLAVPGYLPVEPENAALPDPSALLPDEAHNSMRDALWAAERPKRYLAGWAMVGTIDQLLMGGLRVRHAQLRSAAMLRLLLVIDEVHASDVYMTAILRNLLAQHRAAGGHALLMSATLGSAARTRLLAPTRGPVAMPAFEDAVATPYPAVWAGSAGAPIAAAEDAPVTKTVTVVLEPEWRETTTVVGRAIEAARRGARVLVVRNSVRLAAATHQALEAEAPDLAFGVPDGGDGLVRCPHHARFAREDRLLLDRALEGVLGKDAPRDRGRVVVTTQTAEQSLDIDADLLITDLCPADVLLQRIGRLHRHRRERPDGYAAPMVIVVAPAEGELEGCIRDNGEVRDPPLALGLVYPDLIGVVATRRALAARPVLQIPRDNRPLVEAASHPGHLEALAQALGGAWQRHWGAVLGVQGAHAQAAAHACLDWAGPILPLPSGLDERITTRLGLDDRAVELPDGTIGPFRRPISVITVPGRWLQGVTGDAVAQADSGHDGVLTVTLGGRRFTCDRLGLRPAG